MMECNVHGDRNGGRPCNQASRHLGDWMRSWPWDWWVTLTFSANATPDDANVRLFSFLNELEKRHRDSVWCLIAQEQKTFSGCGKPGGRLHFHLLLASATTLTQASISDLWTLPEFGGSRTSGAAAFVKPYDSEQGAIYYMLKSQDDPAWDFSHRNLDLLSPLRPASADSSSESRRRFKRRDERRAKTNSDPVLSMPGSYQQEYGGPTAGAFELQQRTSREIEHPIVCTRCGSAFFREVEFNQYSDIAMGSGTGGDIRVISQMPQALRVCLCGFPYSPGITGLRGRTATAEMQNFMGSLTKAHAFLRKVQAPAPPLDMPMLIKTFASAQDVTDLKAEVTELGAAFEDSLIAEPVEVAIIPSAPEYVDGVIIPAPPAFHPNSKQGRALRAAAKAAAEAEQAAA